MSSYQTWEALTPTDTSYLSVTCSVTATASMNPAPRGWDVENNNYHMYPNHSTTRYPEANNGCYPCDNPPNNEPEPTPVRLSTLFSPEDLPIPDGDPELDLQTEHSWSNFYPGLERTDSLANMGVREERSCMWLDGGHNIFREAHEFFDGSFKPFVESNSQTMSQSAAQNGLSPSSYIGQDNCSAPTNDFTELHTVNGFGASSEKMRHHGDFAERKMSEWDVRVPDNEMDRLDCRLTENVRCVNPQLSAPEIAMGNNSDLIRPCDLNEDWLAVQKSPINQKDAKDIYEKNHKKISHESANTAVHLQDASMGLSGQKGYGEVRAKKKDGGIEETHTEILSCANGNKQTPATNSAPLPEVKELVDVDHMISSGVTVAGYKPRNIIRKRAKCSVPRTGKDICYWEKRRKNNESARRSREMKKEKEKQFYRRALELEYENLFLKERIGFLETKLSCSSNPACSLG